MERTIDTEQANRPLERAGGYIDRQITLALPQEKLEKVESWGRASSSLGYVYRPTTVGGLKQVFDLSRRSGHSIGLRGSGNSYGDATLNSENIILDLTRMNRILEWNPQSGRIRLEPGVTIAHLWQYILEDGWWPPVVPGTAKPTLGGSLGMNIHGKNAWKAGTIGEHVVEFELMLPSGQLVTCKPNQESELFYSAIGGFGMLGVLTSITLDMHRIYSGLLKVEALSSRNLSEMFEQFEHLLPKSDYLVGWIDSFAKGKSLGRGQIHKANYLPPGADPHPSQSMRLDNQHLPENILGGIPRSMMWRLMRPFMNDLGAGFVNFTKYRSSRLSHGSLDLQSHVAFHFLLDYVPDWKKSYGSGGLIQYQCFVPEADALDAFTEILQHCQKRQLRNYLSVFKRHRRDEFLLSHGVDGYSLAMDFRITPRRRAKMLALAKELDQIVIQAGGRFYLAKDSTLRSETLLAYLGSRKLDKFNQLKQRYDPDGLLQTNLWRRLFT